MSFSSLSCNIAEVISILYGQVVDSAAVKLDKTNTAFEGDYTLVVFPFLKISKKNPELTANEIGEAIVAKNIGVAKFNVVKGFLNLTFSDAFLLNELSATSFDDSYARIEISENDTPILLEYSSPNTNKPLHLGHVRNNLLGWSLAEILKAAGNKVIKVNLVNDRGIHICKTMLAWQKWGNGETPESSKIKGDHLIGNYYVLFDKKNKEMAAGGEEGDTALMNETREMLQKWENNDAAVRTLWSKLNSWVFDGFDATYKRMGVDFDKVYFESQTYLLGKEIVMNGLKSNILVQDNDNSVWIDLTNENLDRKILLRSDGTSVYMTQDIGTAVNRKNDFNAKKMIYVVGNEQNYHFEVLKKTLKRLGYNWSDSIVHFSYGMVELPAGKMKSREGTVVDADDLMDEMKTTAKTIAQELGKTADLPVNELDTLYENIGMGALKYFILRVDPKKNMMFNPTESIDFNGNTGPFIQYTHARICSLIAKAEQQGLKTDCWAVEMSLQKRERDLIWQILDLPNQIQKAAESLSPAVIANYAYDLAKLFNTMYQDLSVLKEADMNLKQNRLMLAFATKNCLKNSMSLLGINMPERM